MKIELVRSLVEFDVSKNEDLAKMADNVINYEGAIPVVKEYQIVIRFQKKCMLNAEHRQGCVFKIFKESNKFVEMVKELEVSKSTIYFKINLVKILGKYPKLKKSSLSLTFLKIIQNQ